MAGGSACLHIFNIRESKFDEKVNGHCGSPPGVMMADTLSFNAKIGVVDNQWKI